MPRRRGARLRVASTPQALGYTAALFVGHEVACVSDGGDLPCDKFVTTTYPVIITWDHADQDGDSALPEDHITVACIQANVASPGSQTPAANNEVKLSFSGISVFIEGAVLALLS